MKVLIITYYWPPSGGSGVQRWLKFATYLSDFGIEPVVYTVDDPHYAILDKTLENEVPKSIKIIKKSIREPNNLVSLFGKKNKKRSAGFLDANPSFFGMVAQYIRANYFIPDARKYWIKPSVKFLTKFLSKNGIDMVITTGPPHSLHLIGLELKKRIGVKWMADFRDPWTEIDYFHQLPLTNRAKEKHHQLEKEVVSRADCVLVVGKTMQQNYLKYNKNIKVITNGFDGDLNTDNVQLDKKFTMVHVGLINADRNPKVLFRVISKMIKENKDFANNFELILIGKLADEVNKNIEKYQLKSYVKIIDYLPHHEVINYQKMAQVLLLIVNNVPSAKGIITGKIFEYLQANRPVLAIGPTDGDLAEIIGKTNSGTIVDFKDIKTLRSTLIECYNEYKNHNLAVKSKNIEQYHRKNLTEKLADIINNVTLSNVDNYKD